MARRLKKSSKDAAINLEILISEYRCSIGHNFYGGIPPFTTVLWLCDSPRAYSIAVSFLLNRRNLILLDIPYPRTTFIFLVSSPSRQVCGNRVSVNVDWVPAPSWVSNSFTQRLCPPYLPPSHLGGHQCPSNLTSSFSCSYVQARYSVPDRTLNQLPNTLRILATTKSFLLTRFHRRVIIIISNDVIVQEAY